MAVVGHVQGMSPSRALPVAVLLVDTCCQRCQLADTQLLAANPSLESLKLYLLLHVGLSPCNPEALWQRHFLVDGGLMLPVPSAGTPQRISPPCSNI